ncbi:MAG: hypothetical protein J4F29_06470 [Candidatus Latescibacteria bacterium]|nr:hypothetical protein [Candidatus Latescibacterota bacterium]
MDMSWGFLGVFAVLMLVVVLWSRKIRHQQVNAIASIVTVIGVLGTFAGIAWGLLNFDTQNIEASVPLLLEGLKFAFLTSIIGIAGSICLKLSFLNKLKKQAASEKTYTGATIDDLANILQEIHKIHQAEGNETRETLRAIEKALTGDGDSTVLTQLQKLRTTFSDKQDDLLHAFKEFATQMADNNTKALIEALESVMRDFNAKINEQFGDNFKQLNEAVGRINDWQEQYRQQMDELATEFGIAAESIEKSRQSLESIAERSDVIVSSAEKLDPILQAIQQQIQLMNDRLEAFSALADNASNAFPIIEERLNQLTHDFTQVVAENIDNSQASIETQRETLADLSQQLETMVMAISSLLKQQTETVFRETTERVEQVIDSTFQGLKGTLEDQSQQLKSIVTETTNNLSTVAKETIDNSQASMERQREALTNQAQQLETMVTDTNRRLNTETERIFRESTAGMTQQIQLLDTALQEELTKSIESLGSQLASLSRRFVDDYSPLTERLRDVVQIANGLPQTSPHRRSQ